MSTVVVYASKSGYTKRYADIIARELSADILSISDITHQALSSYDNIIFGGGVYASRINGASRFLKICNTITSARIVMFVVGFGHGTDDEVSMIRQANIPKAFHSSISLFYMRGGFDMAKLSLPAKIAMKLMTTLLKLKKNRTAHEQEMIDSCRTPMDFVTPERASPLIDAVQNLQNNE